MHDLRHLDWNEIITCLQNSATSGTARQSLAQLAPLPNVMAAEKKINDIFSAMEVLAQGTRPFMESVDLFPPWHGRLKRKAILKNLEIKDVRSFCLECVALQEVLKMCRNSWTQDLLSQLMNAGEPLSAIDQILTPRGEIRSDASETLFRLFREKESIGRQIESSLDKLVKDHDIQGYLQDRYVTTREGRWVLPVRSGNQHSVVGVIHGSSQTKQTVFMEPSLVVPLNNRLRQVEVEIEDEIERLLSQLSDYLAGHVQDFARSRDLLEDVDGLFAQAQWSLQIEAKPFVFSEHELHLREVKHPLMQLAAKKPVSNTVDLNAQKSILLLSGPNAGGKTVLLKSIGLAAHMARCGLPICAAEGSRIPFFAQIHIGLGDSQSVDAELSTFAAHIKVLQAATELQGNNNLILIDEICGSTDPEEGAALARSFIECFAQQQCFAVITSHLGPLKSGWQENLAVMSGSLEYDDKTGRPTYQFLPGVPGDSLAIQTAKRVGVSKNIIERSLQLLSPSTRQRLAGLEELNQLKLDLHNAREQMRKDSARAKAEQEKYQQLMQQFALEKEHLLHKTVRQAEKQIDELIAQAKAEETFKKHSQLQEIKHELPQMIKASVVLAATAGSAGASTTVLNSAEDFAKKFPTGSKVYVPSLQQDGIVQSLPNGKGEVMILANSMRLNLRWQDLKPPQVAQNPTASLVRRSREMSSISVALSDHERTMDLRGMTVDEAMGALESELDRASAGGSDTRPERIKIIHGHGTEALKKAVRTYLSRSVYVKKWKAGSPEQGGDGVTWVELGGD